MGTHNFIDFYGSSEKRFKMMFDDYDLQCIWVNLEAYDPQSRSSTDSMIIHYLGMTWWYKLGLKVKV